MSIGLALWYFHWRVMYSANDDAWFFSWLVIFSEGCLILSTLIFFYDTWDEADRRIIMPPDALLARGNSIDIFITTYDEAADMVEDTIKDALAIKVPPGFFVITHLLDDGDRVEFRNLAAKHMIQYHRRDGNDGYKAGNLKNALQNSSGDFVVIADADTRFFLSFLENTLGYFHNPMVAWVQTPHWFYDLPNRSMSHSRVSRFIGKLRRRAKSSSSGYDPFFSDPSIFFDIIQRRRDRHGASFCCGAGSIHRRDILYQVAMRVFQENRLKISAVAHPAVRGELSKVATMQPFKFHVSEDIFTSMLTHSVQGGRFVSVYHPQIECKMLSPWTLRAWASQRLKYAGGTYDIFMRRIGMGLGGMRYKTWLHYACTFISYISVVPQLILFAAPIISLLTGVAPVAAYSWIFFLHLLPVLLATEVALLFGMKGYDIQSSRNMSLVTAPFLVKGFWQVLTRQSIGFKPTPKTLDRSNDLNFVFPHLSALGLCIFAILFALIWSCFDPDRYTAGLLVVNIFWVTWNARIFAGVCWLLVSPPVLPISKLEG